MARRQRSVTVKAGDLLHVETPLGIVNIRAGLTDSLGRRVDSIETLPNDYAGEPRVEIAGLANTRLIEEAVSDDD